MDARQRSPIDSGNHGRRAARAAADTFAETVHTYCAFLEGHHDHRRVEFTRGVIGLLGRLLDDGLQFSAGHGDRQTRRLRMLVLDEWRLNPQQHPTFESWTPAQREQARRNRALVARRFTIAKRDFPAALRRLRQSVIPVQDFFALSKRLREFLGPHDDYYIQFNPYQVEKPMRVTIANDLAEIWHDVKQDLLLYRVGTARERQEAVWSWRFGLGSHYGRHIAHALTALTHLLADLDFNDEE